MIVSRNLVCMFFEGIVFFILTILIEYRFFLKPRYYIPSSLNFYNNNSVMLTLPYFVSTRHQVILTCGFFAYILSSCVIICSSFIRRIPVSKIPIKAEDEDVADERNRVVHGDADTDLVRIENLTKVRLLLICLLALLLGLLNWLINIWSNLSFHRFITLVNVANIWPLIVFA